MIISFHIFCKVAALWKAQKSPAGSVFLRGISPVQIAGLSTEPSGSGSAANCPAFAAAYLMPSPSAPVFSARLLSTMRAKTMETAVPMGVNTTVQHARAPVY